MPDTGAVPVEPRPAASVIIVRDAAAGAAEPIEVYMIRRQRSMKFLGGFYAFPGGKVDPGDAAPAVLAGCRRVRRRGATRRKPPRGSGSIRRRAIDAFSRKRWRWRSPPSTGWRTSRSSARWTSCGPRATTTARSSRESSTASSSNSGRTSTGGRGDGLADEISRRRAHGAVRAGALGADVRGRRLRQRHLRAIRRLLRAAARGELDRMADVSRRPRTALPVCRGGRHRTRRSRAHPLSDRAGGGALRRHRLCRSRDRGRPRRVPRELARRLARRRRLGRARHRAVRRLAGGPGACRPSAAADGIVNGHTTMANATLSFLDDHVANGRGARPAIVTVEATTTYAELLGLVCRTGHVLRGAGVERGQRVALLLPDGVAWAAAFFGALRIGAVAVPLNTRLGAADWAGMLADSGARVLVADATLLGDLTATLGERPQLERVIVAGDGGNTALEALQARASDTLPAEPVDDEAMAFWLCTSGTTGGAKAAVHRHGDLLACRHYGIDVLGATEGDRILATSKLFFAYALGNALLIPLYAGAQTFLDARWAEPDVVARTVTAFRPTLFFSVPTFYARMLRADLAPDTFRSVRACVSAGERLPAEIYDAWRTRFGVEILDGLGATETIFMVLSNRPGASRAGSTGTVVPGTDARLLDADGRPVPDGVPGVLHVRTPSASRATGTGRRRHVARSWTAGSAPATY